MTRDPFRIMRRCEHAVITATAREHRSLGVTLFGQQKEASMRSDRNDPFHGLKKTLNHGITEIGKLIAPDDADEMKCETGDCNRKKESRYASFCSQCEEDRQIMQAEDAYDRARGK